MKQRIIRKRVTVLAMVLFALVASVGMSSCKNDDDVYKSLKGTKWTRMVDDNVAHLEFVSDNEVNFYLTKDGVLSSTAIYSAEYVCYETFINFSGFTCQPAPLSATFSSNSQLEVTYTNKKTETYLKSK